MEAQQATFSTFNEAAERVAENLDENSPGVEAIQDKMEEFNDNWNKITTHLADRLTLVSVPIFCCQLLITCSAIGFEISTTEG